MLYVLGSKFVEFMPHSTHGAKLQEAVGFEKPSDAASSYAHSASQLAGHLCDGGIRERQGAAVMLGGTGLLLRNLN